MKIGHTIALFITRIFSACILRSRLSTVPFTANRINSVSRCCPMRKIRPKACCSYYINYFSDVMLCEVSRFASSFSKRQILCNGRSSKTWRVLQRSRVHIACLLQNEGYMQGDLQRDIDHSPHYDSTKDPAK